MNSRAKLLVIALIAGGLLAALPADGFACPVCFGMEEGPAAEGIRAAVVVLMGATVAVLAGAAVFIGRFVRRAAAQSVDSPRS